jgi:hypothetical protein
MTATSVIIAEQGAYGVNVALPGIQGPQGPSVVAGTIPDGTAAAPGLAFTNDIDTGIFRPGANRFAFATGGVLRTEVDASGNLVHYGDIKFQDSGSFETTLQLVTPTANRVITFPDLTGTVALVGGTSGQILYNLNGGLAGTGITFSSTTGTRFTLPFGYATGAGGVVTQQTNKSTGVTLDSVCGEITMNGAALSAGAAVSFVFTNSRIAAGDKLVLNHDAGGNVGDYSFQARCANGSATIAVRNMASVELSEAVVIGFALLKASTT